MCPRFCVMDCLYCCDIFRMFFVVIAWGKYRPVYCFRVKVGEFGEYSADLFSVSDCYGGGMGYAVADEIRYFVAGESGCFRVIASIFRADRVGDCLYVFIGDVVSGECRVGVLCLCGYHVACYGDILLYSRERNGDFRDTVCDEIFAGSGE